MKKGIMFAVVLATCVAFVTAQNYPSYTAIESQPSTDPGKEEAQVTLASTLSAYLIEAIGRGLQFLFELFDIKVRSIRFLASLYSTENLVLLKKVLNVGLRLGNWAYTIIPDSTDSTSHLLSFLFPHIDEGKDDDDNNLPDVSFGDSSFPGTTPSTESPVSISEITVPSDEVLASLTDRERYYLNNFAKRAVDLTNLINGVH